MQQPSNKAVTETVTEPVKPTATPCNNDIIKGMGSFYGQLTQEKQQKVLKLTEEFYGNFKKMLIQLNADIKKTVTE
jgi:ClpP class serine protease